MTDHDIGVRFWGVRGSYPVPGKDTLKYGGNTSCIEIRTKNHIIILDAGTGIIGLGEALLKELEGKDGTDSLKITLLISHTHHDHIQGLPFFAPAYHDGTQLNIYGPKTYTLDLLNLLSQTMDPHYSPIQLDDLRSQINIHNLSDNHTLVLGENSDPEIYAGKPPRYSDNDVVVQVMRSYAHPKDGVFIFRIQTNGKSIVYATDTEGYIGGDTRLINFAQQANLLIHDAQYDSEEYGNADFPKQGFGHSTYEMAADVAKAAQVKNLVLFHHDPSHDDRKLENMESKARELFPNTTVGFEGLDFSF